MSSARLDRLAVLGLLICFIVRLRAEPGDPGNKGHFLLNRKIPQAPGMAPVRRRAL